MSGPRAGTETTQTMDRSASTIDTTDSTTRRLIALDIDGTLLGFDGRVPAGTVAALDLVRAAGHEVVLASGRSLVGLGPVATRLGLTEGYAVCSNGAVTLRLDPRIPTGYVIQHAHRFDPGPVIQRARELAPDVRVGIEEAGWGWRVSELFDSGLLNGEQKQVSDVDLSGAATTRVALHAPDIRQQLDALRAMGLTVIPAGPDWLDLTAPGTGKAAALERLRQHLGIGPESTVAVGDGRNDVSMLEWAGRSVAMGHAPAAVRQVADEVTGSIDQHGALTVLYSVLPDVIDTSLPPLAAQLATAVRTTPGPIVVRVWHDDHPEVARCDTWTLHDGTWIRHSPIPSGTRTTMRAIEVAAREAGLSYPRGEVGRRRAHWRSARDSGGRVGFELPLL